MLDGVYLAKELSGACSIIGLTSDKLVVVSNTFFIDPLQPPSNIVPSIEELQTKLLNVQRDLSAFVAPTILENAANVLALSMYRISPEKPIDICTVKTNIKIVIRKIQRNT